MWCSSTHTRLLTSVVPGIRLPVHVSHFASLKASCRRSTRTGTAAAGGDREGPNVVSVDWRLPIDVAWDRLPAGTGIQGNLDPARLMAPWEVIQAGADDILGRVANRPGHVFNLGHGVMPQTDPDKLARLVEHVHESTVR